MATRVLCFDIGIKNLAWCVLEAADNQTYKILGWDNVNIMETEENATPKLVCSGCKAKPSFLHNDSLYCARHCPLTHPPLKDVDGNNCKTIPSANDCKALLQKKQGGIPKKIEDVVKELEKYFSLPIPKNMKPKSVMYQDLSLYHDGIRTMILKQKELWSTCTLFCLENQPVLKNPTMKSIQMLLYASLRDIISTAIPIKLVHAGKKVQGKTKGDEGYKERKDGSEARAFAFLNGSSCAQPFPWTMQFTQAKKKSDLADALCMCLDACGA
jgi:hypothetical protein